MTPVFPSHGVIVLLCPLPAVVDGAILGSHLAMQLPPTTEATF